MPKFTDNSDARFTVLEATDGSININIYSESLEKVQVKINYHDADDAGNEKSLDLPVGRLT